MGRFLFIGTIVLRIIFFKLQSDFYYRFLPIENANKFFMTEATKVNQQFTCLVDFLNLSVFTSDLL